MNNKHIAVLILVIICILVFQGVSKVRHLATEMQQSAERAQQAAKVSFITLTAQRGQLDELNEKSADTLAYLSEWEPQIALFPTPESGESHINNLIKEEDLMLLAQRFEVLPNKITGTVPNPEETTIPKLVRAHLTIEDDFVKTLNWLGNVEGKLPISRVSSVDLARGQSGNDLRMNVIIDLPLARAPLTETPQP